MGNIYADAHGIYEDDGNRVTFFAHCGGQPGDVIEVDSVPATATLMKLEKVREPKQSPAERWGDRMVELVAKRRVTGPDAWRAIGKTPTEWAKKNKSLAGDIKAVCVEQYAPAPQKRVANDFAELKRIAKGNEIAYMDADGNYGVWRASESRAHWFGGTLNIEADDTLFPMEILRVKADD